jgi:hypothetical protein
MHRRHMAVGRHAPEHARQSAVHTAPSSIHGPVATVLASMRPPRPAATTHTKLSTRFSAGGFVRLSKDVADASCKGFSSCWESILHSLYV